MGEKDAKFEVKGYVSQADIPEWVRRPPKWNELMDVVRQLQPGDTILIEFEDPEEANRARNVVRDELNAEIGRAAIRTRLVKGKQDIDAPTKVFFTRLHPLDLVEEDYKYD